MFWAVTQRENVGDFLGRLRVGPRSRHDGPVPQDELRRLDEDEHRCVVVWSRDPAAAYSAPVALVTAEGQEREWLAWLTAFAPAYRPFTAYCRVLGGRAFSLRLEGKKPVPDLGPIEGACVGLIMGELLSSDEGLARPREVLPASASASTLSFALARDLALYQLPIGREDLVERWALTRMLTRQRERPLKARDVVEVVEVLDATARDTSSTVAARDYQRLAVKDLINNDGVLKRFSSPLLDFDLGDGATREERVTKFSLALRIALDAEQPHGSFTLGYLASRLNPGTLSHAQLLAPALARYPAAMLWYGVCAGISGRSAILSAHGGLGRRALRDLYSGHNLFETPRCDLGWEELAMFLRERPDDPPEFIVGTPTQLTVELDAGIWTVVNWSRGRPRRAEEPTEDRKWLLAEIGSAVGRLADVYNRLQGERDREQRPGYYRDRDAGPAQASLAIDALKAERRPRKR